MLTLPFTLPTSPLDLPVLPDVLARVAHCAEGKKLLLSQFRGKPRIEGVLCALLDAVQDWEDVVLQVYMGRWIDVAEGIQLDQLGDLIDLARAGWPDETYRMLLRAQILVLRSDGEWPDIFGVLAAIGYTAVHGHDVAVAAMHVLFDEPFNESIGAKDTFGLLERTRPGSLRLSMFFPVDDAPGFELSDTTPETDLERGFGDAVANTIGGELFAVLASTGVA